MVRNEKRFHRQAQEEIRILEHLRKQDPEGAANVVRMLDTFTFRNHICITFELLSMNLYELIKKNKFQVSFLNTQTCLLTYFLVYLFIHTYLHILSLMLLKDFHRSYFIIRINVNLCVIAFCAILPCCLWTGRISSGAIFGPQDCQKGLLSHGFALHCLVDSCVCVRPVFLCWMFCNTFLSVLFGR